MTAHFLPRGLLAAWYGVITRVQDSKRIVAITSTIRNLPFIESNYWIKISRSFLSGNSKNLFYQPYYLVRQQGHLRVMVY
jgi:S-adenosylmethionine hydrolase